MRQLIPRRGERKPMRRLTRDPRTWPRCGGWPATRGP